MMPWVDQTLGWAPPMIRRLPRLTIAARLPFRLPVFLIGRQTGREIPFRKIWPLYLSESWRKKRSNNV